MNEVVKQQYNVHIIPFAYEESYENVRRIMAEKCEIGHWTNKDIGDVNLLKHVNNLVSNRDDLQNGIGKRYSIMQSGRKDLGLPQNSNSKLTFEHKKGKFKYEIVLRQLDLFLFETNIGFVVLRFEYPNQTGNEEIDLDTIAKINYELKRLVVSANTLSYNKKISIDKSEKYTFRLQDIVEKVTEDLKVKTYFDDSDKVNGDNEKDCVEVKRINKSIVFSSVLLDKQLEKEAIISRLFQMRRAFKVCSIASESELDITNNKEVMRLFDNNYWGISLEGIANITYKTSENDMEVFYQSEALVRLENTYLYLYLIVLNMRYSLLHFSLLSSELPKSLNECISIEEGNNTDLINISELEERIAFFRLRCVFRIVSSITHQNEIYKVMWKVNNVDILLEELNSEVNALSAMSELRKVKLEKEEKKKREDEKKKKEDEDKIIKKSDQTFKDIFIIISLVFTILSAFGNIEKIIVSGTAVVEAMYTPHLLSSKIIMFIFVLLIALVVITLRLYYKYILKPRKGKKEDGGKV